ncbi:MAG: hypothetical protein DID92_2727744586 [Candidatus Nitrotoga sp. SPKER]|nr:MAG: hypothetical protein DID92_2727744586 [Candidatus Nitrotoga sp. SPKER]
MKKTIINLAIVSCLTLAVTSVYADLDTSMSDRSGNSDQSNSDMSAPSDASGLYKSKAPETSKSDMSGQSGKSEENSYDAPKDSDH